MKSLPDRDLGLSGMSAFRAGIPIGGRRFTSADAGMILVMTLLRHATVAPTRAIRDRMLRDAKPLADRLLADTLSCLPDATHASSSLTVFRLLAQHTSDGGDLVMSTHILDSLERLATPNSLELGRILVSRAYLEQGWGRLSFGEGRLNAILHHPHFARHKELRLRAQQQLAVIALGRGNVPTVEDMSRNVIREAGGHFPQIEGMAHGSLAVSSAYRRDFDAAIRHAWYSFACFEGTRFWRITALGNMAQILLDAGHPVPARSAAAWVISQAPQSPGMLPSIGCYAIASAALGDRAGVEWATEHVLLAAKLKGSFQQTVCDALLECSVALATLGETARAGTLRRRALRIAQQCGFHRHAFFAEQPVTNGPSTKAHPLSTEASAIAETVAGMEPAGRPSQPVHVG